MTGTLGEVASVTEPMPQTSYFITEMMNVPSAFYRCKLPFLFYNGTRMQQGFRDE
jgi:hypothetical protein